MTHIISLFRGEFEIFHTIILFCSDCYAMHCKQYESKRPLKTLVGKQRYAKAKWTFKNCVDIRMGAWEVVKYNIYKLTILVSTVKCELDCDYIYPIKMNKLFEY